MWWYFGRSLRGGAVTALYEDGFGEVFDTIIGISSGAPTAAYFMGGNPRLGTSIYYDECCNGRFLRGLSLRSWLQRPLKTLANPVGIEYLDKVFRGSTNKPINCEAVFAHCSRLYISVTRQQTADSWMVNACGCDVLHTAINASCAMPGLSSDRFVLLGSEVIDGMVAEPFPGTFLAALDPQPTHTLVMTNRTKLMPGWLRRTFEQVLFGGLFRWRMEPQVRRFVLSREKRFRSLLTDYCNTLPTVAVIWSDGRVKGMETDKNLLRQVAKDSEQWWHELLAQ